MNSKQKDFILKELIPFIKRDAGRGFAMETWWTLFDTSVCDFDGIPREAPSCGTAACIGGSISILLTLKEKNLPIIKAQEVIGRAGVGQGDMVKATGLSDRRLDGLFNLWEPPSEESLGWKDASRWPISSALAFKRARTTVGKANVACKLLEKIVETEGKCLEDWKDVKNYKPKYESPESEPS